jgi:hypothetical protein
MPKFLHDCKNCKFLGTVKLNVGEIAHVYDMYYCLQGADTPTILVRWDSREYDYISSLSAAKNSFITPKANILPGQTALGIAYYLGKVHGYIR